MRSIFLALSFLLVSTIVAEPAQKFQPFTGKVVANKVRIRTKPDLESPIVRQVNKSDLLLIVKEEGDFFAVEPMKDTKAYVFRSYILDNVVEANRVNVRLEPHVDAPIIGQLCAGDQVQGNPCPINHKWLEITVPKGTTFFVAKDFVTQVGGPEYIAKMEKKKAQVEELLSAAFLNAEAECKKPYEEMAPQQAIEQFQTILRNFADFPEVQQQAKEGLALLKETYLNKKIAYLEAKAELTPSIKEELLAQHVAESGHVKVDSALWQKKNREHSGLWDPIEESLYLSWTAFHTGKTFEDYYEEQKANAFVLNGTVEHYKHDVHNKPGDYLLRNNADVPVAYLYSTQIDLEQYVGKTVALLAAPRPNHHFAFPAYFVFSVE